MVVLERLDRGQIGVLELSAELRLCAERPVVVVVGESACVPEADPVEHREHLGHVEHRPVFVEVFMGHVVRVGLYQPVDELGRERLVVDGVAALRISATMASAWWTQAILSPSACPAKCRSSVRTGSRLDQPGMQL